MNLSPQIKHNWASLLALPLKVGVVCGAAALFVYYRALNIPGTMASTVHQNMKVICEPVALGCVVACVTLLGIGGFELFQRRRKHAIWNFAFALVAFIVWTEAQGLMSRVK